MRTRRPAAVDTSGVHVGVVIPCFEYADYLEDAVRSVLEQRGVTVEIVIVDDASTDDSLVVARRLAAADERVQVLAHTVNTGPVATFNDGLARVSGDYLVRLDADDMLTPGSLARAVAVGESEPTVGLIYGHPLHLTGETRPPARERATSWAVWHGQDWLADRCRNALNVITSPEVVMRRSVVDLVGGQRDLAHTHDMEMWLRIAAVADVAYIRGADQAWHRDHPRSLSAREVDPLRDLQERRDAFDVLFDGVGDRIVEVDRRRTEARAALAADACRRIRGLYDRVDVDRDLADRYGAFVRSVVDDPSVVRGWHATERRRGRDSGSAVRPTFVLDRLTRRVASHRAWRRWHRHGVF
ncbi:glycosyltransferase family 2 protein [Rhodococcoides kroppenstedtii]|uniref:glycosyltransferase family 2 protein n=1 Tax=Rhodococcoides kroppenstedtii TaxID=293050 RepID=UPI0021BE1D20|nr:glycosyltransferase family 2 protein [Rhodococcus kroppenstedtii]